MPQKAVSKAGTDPVIQFSVFIDNKVGRLLEIIGLIESHNCHVLGFTVLDTTDSCIIRMVVSDPDRIRSLFQENAISFTETHLIAVEINANTDLKPVLSALLQAEVNILYAYSFLFRPRGKAALVLNVDDPDCAEHALIHGSYRVIHQRDLSR